MQGIHRDHQHSAHEATDYSDDAVYRSLVAESLESANIAQSVLQLWLRDESQHIHIIEDYSLLKLHRLLESFIPALARNADVRLAWTDDGTSPLDISSCNGHVSIADALRTRGLVTAPLD